MKIYAIRDASISKERDLAWLLYYPEAGEYHIEISEEVDEWEAPLLLSSFVKRGKRSLDPDASRQWAELRVIPPDRQNLGMILRDNGLEEYDPYRLLTLAGGRCAQDDCFLVPLRESRMPPPLRERLRRTIVSFIPSGSAEGRHRHPEDPYAGTDLSAGNAPESCLLFFRDGIIRRISASELLSEDLKDRQKIRLAVYRGGTGTCQPAGRRTWHSNRRQHLFLRRGASRKRHRPAGHTGGFPDIYTGECDRHIHSSAASSLHAAEYSGPRQKRKAQTRPVDQKQFSVSEGGHPSIEVRQDKKAGRPTSAIK